MFKNYFTTALRSLWKNKVVMVINILGLAIGISASLVIYLLVNYHFTFDKFEKDSDRIYRVVSVFGFSGEVYHNSGVPVPMGNGVKKELTGIDDVASFRTWQDEDDKIKVTVSDGNKPVIYKNQSHLVFADENYFKLIPYEWQAGSSKTAFQQPYDVVLTESNAKLYFPKLTAAEIIGKELFFNDTIRTRVTGVVKDIAQNTDFDFKTFISYTTLESTSLKPRNWDSWDNTNGASQLFIKLSKGTSPQHVQSEIEKLYSKYHHKEANDHSTTQHLLQPFSDLHFNADYGSYDLPLANKPTLYGLLAVAAFLLLLGCINFINLTTANASQRAKEIGIRKTMGGSRKQLIFQFLSETFMLTLVAAVLSLLLVPVLLKAFAGFIPEALHYSITEQPGILAFLFVLVLVVTLLSGFYPALILSGYKPVLVLKNQAFANSKTTRSAWLRRSLTVSQFVIAQVFIMATFLVSRQITYSLNKDMGFKKDAIVHFQANFYDTIKSHKQVLISKLQSIPEIAMVSVSTATPSSGSMWSGTMTYKDGKKEIEADVQQKFGDTNYIGLYHIQLLAGRNFRASDSVNEFVINETYARLLGFQQPQQAIGKLLTWSDKQIPIVGVAADFNQKSLREPIKPLAIGTWNNTEHEFNIALQPQNADGTTWKTAISKIEKAYKDIYPEDDFSYSFFDKDIAQYYDEEQHTSTLLTWATGLAVFISCLGLLGLVIYTTTQRTKEIGVRKVLGASVSQIISLISKDFLLLIVIAFLIAVPLAWIGINKWLQNFAYRTDVSPGIFVLSGCIMIVVALLTLGFQTAKAAIANPVKSLRTE